MHPLVAIGLVFLTGLAWMGTVLTLLITLAKARRRPPNEPRPAGQGAQAKTSDVETLQT